MRLVKWLLQEFFEVFRWREEWTFFDWVSKTLSGKTMVTGTAAIIAMMVGGLSLHPLITSSAAGALGTSILILIWDRFANRSKKPQIEVGFEKLSPASVVGPISAELADLEHYWNQCQRAYQAIQDCWNRIWRDGRAIRARKELSSKEKSELATALTAKGLDQLFRATEELVARTHQLDEFIDAHFAGLGNKDSN